MGNFEIQPRDLGSRMSELQVHMLVAAFQGSSRMIRATLHSCTVEKTSASSVSEYLAPWHVLIHFPRLWLNAVRPTPQKSRLLPTTARH